MLAATPAAAAPMPATPAAGTPAVVAQQAPAGQWLHAVDLHGRPWQDPPGISRGVSLFTRTAGARTFVEHVGDGLLHPWQAGAVLAAEADPDGLQNPLATPGLTRFGWHTLGRMGTAPLAWPAGGAQAPVRDTLRVAVCDPAFHLLGNRTDTDRDTVGRADTVTVAEQPPIIREGSPVALLPDGRSALGWIGAGDPRPAGR